MAGLLFVYWKKPPILQKFENHQQTTAEGVFETTIILAAGKDDTTGKINRIGQKRSIQEIERLTGVVPADLNFGTDPVTLEKPPKKTGFEKSPFPPLMSVKIRGKRGTFEIQGDLYTQRWSKEITKDEEFDVYPEYNWDQEEESRQWENINISFKEGNKKETIQTINLEWSGENEIFLADSCLPHLVELTDLKSNPILRPNIGSKNPTPQNIVTWIRQNTKALEPYQLTYEEMPPHAMQYLGWQTVRTPKEILQERKGNCLDLTILWAGMMLGQNLQTWIIILPEHALVAVGPPNSKPENAIPLETTWLTGENLQNQQVQTALELGRQKIQEELEKNPDQVKIINVNYWKQFFEK